MTSSRRKKIAGRRPEKNFLGLFFFFLEKNSFFFEKKYKTKIFQFSDDDGDVGGGVSESDDLMTWGGGVKFGLFRMT